MGIIKDNNSIKEITLQSLEYFTPNRSMAGAPLVSVAYNCANIERIYLPNIKVFSGSSGRYSPKISYIFLGCKGSPTDKITIVRATNNDNFYIEIGQGTRQILYTNISLTADCIVNGIFNKLADNNFEDDGVTTAPAINITIGRTNLVKLTDEQKAIATDKNYILA